MPIKTGAWHGTLEKRLCAEAPETCRCMRTCSTEVRKLAVRQLVAESQPSVCPPRTSSSTCLSGCVSLGLRLRRLGCFIQSKQ